MPDLRLSGGARWDSLPTENAFTPGFEVGGALELPLFDQHRAQTRDASARLAWAQAALFETEADIQAGVQGAWHRAVALDAARPLPESALTIDPEAVWTAASTRYTSGEDPLNTLLQAAESVQAAGLARVQWEQHRRQAHLALACAIGQLDDVTHQALLEAL